MAFNAGLNAVELAAFNQATSNRFAFKHAHSGRNPEQNWGRHTLAAVRLALYGANPEPAAELVPVIKQAAKKVFVVAGVTGTVGDPQGRAQVVEALRAAGAHVQLTNAAACKLAGFIAAEVVRNNR